MTKINLGEKNELALSVHAMRYKDDLEEEMERKKEEIPAASSNETARREMATELMLQGFSEESICRILNISPDQLPDPLPF